MGQVKSPAPVFLFVGGLYSDLIIFDTTKKRLSESFGSTVFESLPFPWDYSEYYRQEIGGPLFRQFIFFHDLIDPCTLSRVKLKTNEIEAHMTKDKRRRVNLDPGYLTLANVVLATTQNYSHRICIGNNIFAEVTLLYGDGTYKPHLFTYRDYQETPCIGIFLQARTILKRWCDQSGVPFRREL
jgi:hypothetical protein